jgi:nitrite reductase/ring-hydroxylating ferredoxin subunit
MNWNKALAASELPDGGRQVVKIGQQTILCPHLGLPLQKGNITADEALVCPWHKSAFDLNTGAVKSWSPWPPGLGKLLGCLKKETAMTVYPAKEEDGSIWVQCD